MCTVVLLETMEKYKQLHKPQHCDLCNGNNYARKHRQSHAFQFDLKVHFVTLVCFSNAVSGMLLIEPFALGESLR